MALQLIPTAQRVVVGDIVRFVYNGTMRRVLVQQVKLGTDGWLRGEQLVYDGEAPEHQFGTFRFDRILRNKHSNPGIYIETRG